uniref:3-isopropylmalate dehydratase small subunit n=1 Tax=Anthurium amnicola TaxID=1678845 RepID=A0A1D1Y1R4_9ARAE
MEADIAVGIQDAQRLHVESQVFASGMVGERGALWKGALGVLRARQGFVFRMVEVVGASSLVAAREHRGAPYTASDMVVERGAFSRAVLRGLKVVHRSAKVMVEGSVASTRGVVFAQRASMVGLTTVWRMEEGNVVLCQAARRVPVAGLIAA